MGKLLFVFLVRVTKRCRSPTWHRRDRRKRQVARKVLKKAWTKVTHPLSRGRTLRISRALRILQVHHTSPCYRNHPMGGWSSGKGKQKQPWWSTWRRRLSSASQGQGEGQRQRLRQEEGAERERRREAEGQSLRVPGLRLCLISIGFVFISEATIVGRGTQGGCQMFEGKWCRAKRIPCRTAQSRTRAVEQSQGRTEIIEPEEEISGQDR